MITDAFLRVSDAQAITGDAASTNTIDLSVARDIGEGQPLYMVFTVTEAFNNLTSMLLEVVISDSANLGTPTILAMQNALLAGLTVGAQFTVVIPPSVGSLGKRYLGAYYDVTGTNPSTGKVTADIVTSIQDGKKSYASGFTVV
jgi:hypothetical protein